MKIAFLDQIGNINNKYSFSLANELKDKGIDITLITDDKNDTKNLRANLERLFFCISNEHNPAKKVMQYIQSWKRIYNYCINQGVEILHVQWFIFSPVDYYYINKLRNKGIKIVVTIHDILPFNKKFYDYKYHSQIYKIADKIIVQAEINRTRLENEFNINKKKIVFIPHGNFVEHVDEYDMDEAKNYLNIPKDKDVLLFFGQIKKVKGLSSLIDAMNLVVKSKKDVMLVIAGKTWKDSFETYKNQIDSYNINDFIRSDIKFIPDEEIGYYFCSSDIVILPYLNVYQSGVVQLAYAYRKPVIATEVGGLPEVVLDKKTGRIVQPNNPQQLAEAIIELLNSKDSTANMGVEGRKFIENEFSWSKIGSDVKDIYNEVLRCK